MNFSAIKKNFIAILRFDGFALKENIDLGNFKDLEELHVRNVSGDFTIKVHNRIFLISLDSCGAAVDVRGVTMKRFSIKKTLWSKVLVDSGTDLVSIDDSNLSGTPPISDLQQKLFFLI